METIVNIPVRIVRHNDGSYEVSVTTPEPSGDRKIDFAIGCTTGLVVDRVAERLRWINSTPTDKA